MMIHAVYIAVFEDYADAKLHIVKWQNKRCWKDNATMRSVSCLSKS